MASLIEEYFLLYFIYSVIGWGMETSLISIKNKRLINRGFLLGPYCPIYGAGALFIILIVNKFSNNDPVLLFLLTVFVCGALEYLTSWIMEVCFKARWWDYSNRKFNLNGRICLMNLIAFGVLGLMVIYVLNPFFTSLLTKLNESQIKWIAIGLSIIFIIDNIISFIVIFGFRKATKYVNSEGKADNTEQITKMVRELLSEKSFLHRRFINAYPRLEAIQIKIKEIKNKIDDVTTEAKVAVNEKKEELKNRIEDVTSDAKVAINVKKEQIKGNLKNRTRRVRVKLYLGKKTFKREFKGKIKFMRGGKEK